MKGFTVIGHNVVGEGLEGSLALRQCPSCGHRGEVIPMTMWTAGVDGADYETPDPGPYPTREAAVAALAAMPHVGAYLEDDQVRLWVAPVDGEMRVRDCSCYGRWVCAACILAQEAVTFDEIVTRL